MGSVGLNVEGLSWVLPPPVIVYIRGPIKGYNHIIIIIQLLLRGGAVPKV